MKFPKAGVVAHLTDDGIARGLLHLRELAAEKCWRTYSDLPPAVFDYARALESEWAARHGQATLFDERHGQANG